MSEKVEQVEEDVEPLNEMRADIDKVIEDIEEKNEEPGDDIPPEMQLPRSEEDQAKERAEEKDDEPETGEEAPPPDESEQVSEEETESEGSRIKAPLGWKDDALKEWDNAPDAVKERVTEREREVAVLMQQTASERRLARDFATTMDQYKEPMMQMGFKNPFDAVNTVMNMAVKMNQGSVQDRAKAAAEVIQAFNVDIGALDDALVDTGNASPTQNVERLLDQRLAPINQLLGEINQAKEMQQTQTQQQTGQEVQQFMASKEFANEVRMDMADLLDLAAQRGESMTLDDAYDRACQMNPTVRDTLFKRQATETAAAKKVAASSVRGNPGGSGTPKKANSMEEQLNEAWDLHLGGG